MPFTPEEENEFMLAALELRQRIPAPKLLKAMSRAEKILTMDRSYLIPKSWDGWRDEHEAEMTADELAAHRDRERTAAMIQREIRHLSAVLFHRYDDADALELATELWGRTGQVTPDEVDQILCNPIHDEQHSIFTLLDVCRRLAAGEAQATIEEEGYSHYIVTTIAKFGFHEFIVEQRKLFIEMADRNGWNARQTADWWTTLWPDLKSIGRSTCRRLLQQCRAGEGAWA